MYTTNGIGTGLTITPWSLNGKKPWTFGDVIGCDPKEVACAAFNVAVACEMQGLFDLARKCGLLAKTLDMPETNITRTSCRNGTNKRNCFERKDPRIHKTVVSFNDREMAVIDHFCEKYNIKVRSRMYREAIIGTILRKLEEDHPRLF